MINIFVTISVSDRNRAELLQLLEQLVSASQEESGNIHYQHYYHPKNPELIVIFEQWENQAVLDAHEQTPHFTTILPQIGELASSVKINKL